MLSLPWVFHIKKQIHGIPNKAIQKCLAFSDLMWFSKQWGSHHPQVINIDSMPNFQTPSNMPNFHQFSMVSMGFSAIFTKFPIDLWDSMAKWLVSTHEKIGLFLHCRSSEVLENHFPRCILC